MAFRLLKAVLPGIAAAGLVATLLSGCSDGTALVVESNSSGHVLMSDARHAEVAQDDHIEGTLTMVGTCFGLETTAGTFAAVFPQGSGLISNTDQVEIPGWGTLGLDNHYEGGGAILQSSTLSFHDAIPTECQANRLVVLNPIR
jgi:hypothetical protein